MNKFKTGDRVKLSNDFIKNSTNCAEHVEEFKNCIGIVIGPVWEDEPRILDVRWLPSKLRYMYFEHELKRA